MKKDRKALPDMAYNTSHEFLIMPEYGRNVQQLVRHAQKLEDSAYRQQFCEQIVDLIQHAPSRTPGGVWKNAQAAEGLSR